MREKGYGVDRRAATREELFDAIAGEVGERDVLYLEFGVYTGAATRYWSKLLRNPASKLHGFDSFEGLPEDWLPHRPKGHFRTEIPKIDDPRVKFFKGWFEDTLPHYEVPPHEALVLNFDADLYSSTKFVLDSLEKAIVPGAHLYFDEFNHRFDELRAFDDFVTRTGMKFSLLGATHALDQVVFRRIS